MSEKDTEDEEKSSYRGITVDLSPNKEIYRSAAVDVDPIDAVEELVDNALDNWARVSQRVDNVTVEIEAKDDTTVVRDNTGGLNGKEVRMLFALGESFQDEVAGSIGAYGIGAKKALVRLGEERVVKSRARNADTGVGFRIDEEWLESDEWDVELEEFEDLEPGVTELQTISNDTVWDESRIERLKQRLRETYSKFLDQLSTQGGRLNVIVNGQELEPPEPVPWSYTPFDGLHPRRFEAIELYPKSIDAPVTMNVTVGHMRNQSAEAAGTDIYIQDRLVTKSETGEVGGYGSVAEDRIGNFTSQNNRLRVIVELNTDGDSSDLPWDGQKTTIDPYDPVSRAMFDWLRRIVRPYFRADAGKVPKAFVEPYEGGHEHAANGGEIEVLDYSNRSNINDRPENNLPMVKRVRSTAETHATKGIFVTDAFNPEYQVAYKQHLLSQFDGDVEDLERLTKGELEEDPVVNTDDLTLSGFLEDINGAGSSKEEVLVAAGYDSVEAISEATIDELIDLDGIGEALATRLIEAAGGSVETEDEEEQNSGHEESTDSGDGSLEDGGETEVDEGPTETADEDDVVNIPLKMSDDEFERLCQQLGFEEDTELEDIGEELKARLLRMFAPAKAA